MGDLRRILVSRPWLPAMVVAAALWIRLLVPAGFMPVSSAGAIYVELCSGHGVEAVPMAMPGMAHDRGGHDGSGKDDQPCGFTGHAPASMAKVDPVLLVLGLAFIVATVFRMPIARPAPRRAFLRPRLRGPPAIG